LGTAWYLQQSGVEWNLLECNSGPGGLASSFQEAGFTWDIGGHILFSHYEAFDNALAGIMSKEEWLVHQREAYIRIHDSWVPYPFQYNIRHLPPVDQMRCLQGVQEAISAEAKPPPVNFREWIDRTMGKGLSDLFMLPYNRKVWAGDPEGMATQWVGERVAVPDINRMRKHLDAGTDDVGWGPNNAFRFPATGGTGAIWQRLVTHLPPTRIHYDCPVTALRPTEKVVLTRDGTRYPFDAVVSTMPLDSLTAMTGLDNLALPASELVHTSTWVAGIGVKGQAPAALQGKCWMYFPEENYPFYRVTVFSHYSPRNVPLGCYSLMAEVSFRPGDNRPSDAELMASCIDGLRRCGLMNDDVMPVQTWIHCADYGYPVPSLGRDSILERVLPELDQLGIYSRGRFGAWKYEVGNMDHAFMQGVEVARRILTGAEEETVWYPDKVNGRVKG
jgi:protoporphyrinogen oxidase